MSVEIQRTEVVLNNRGARGTSGSVLVSSATGQTVSSRMGLAAIASPSAGQVAFLTEAGREGMFAFDSSDLTAAVGGDPAQAIYVAPASATSGISGAWVRRFNGAASAKWFGAVGDGTTNDATALQRWLDRGGALRLPEAKYYSAADLILRTSAVVEGDGYGFDNRIVDGSPVQGYDNQPGSKIFFAAGKGFQAQPQTTQTDETATIVVSQEGSYNSVIRNLALIGPGTGATATGFYSRIYIHLENVHAYKFQGKGFDISAAGGPGADASAEYGNASQSTLKDCVAIGNGSHGFHVRGVDANIIKFDNCSAQLNGGWGFIDESLIGSIYIGGQAATNTLGSYKCIADSSSSMYVGCYVESGLGQPPDLSRMCVVNGGFLATAVINYNVNTNGSPQILGAAGLSSKRVTFTGNEDEGTVLTAGHATIFRGANGGLILQGAGGTFDVVLTNRNAVSALGVYAGTNNIYVGGNILIDGTQVLTTRLAAVVGAGAVGVPPTASDHNEVVTAVNTILARLRTHGLIAT